MSYRKATALDERCVVGIYVDDGAHFQKLMREISREIDHRRARVIPLMAEDITPEALAGMYCFVMPGGADKPYCLKLNGDRNAMLRRFVETGGRYLGVCAGAYYACRAISFNAGAANSVIEPRELALIDAEAIGSLAELAGPYDLKMRTAAAARIEWSGLGKFNAFYHGGPRFVLTPGADAEVVATYADIENAIAALVAPVGQGLAILVGVHCEISSAALEQDLAELIDGADHGHIVGAIRKTENLRRQAFRALLDKAGIPLKGDRAASAPRSRHLH
jgi:glutamine amidotransferase-like uncharacterized protein